jgi:SAM-dependent methyltransferase
MPTQGSQRGIRCGSAGASHTVHVTTRDEHLGRPSVSTITYGTGVPGDSELRLCGDLSGGKRALELGVSDGRNALAFAIAGAKSLAVDPDGQHIERLRALAVEHEVHIECHTGELADLGFATSGSLELVLADHTIDTIDDLGRLLRQVHRVLKPSSPFVIAMRHPFADVTTPGAVYGSDARTFADWFTSLARANFRVDAIHELGLGGSRTVPSTLVLRARKEGS